jgi:hypothetical protein
MSSRPAVRIRGTGEFLRLRVSSAPEPLATARECSRASTAIDKALGEAVRNAVAAGHTWDEIGGALGCSTATDPQQVLEDFQVSRRWIWRRFWGLTDE